jgi:hypothetical protein
MVIPTTGKNPVFLTDQLNWCLIHQFHNTEAIPQYKTTCSYDPMKQSNITHLISFGPRIDKSPFFDATRRYGSKAYSIYNHMYMPLNYEDSVADYWRLVNDVTLWDVACERQGAITGPDAFRLVQRLTPAI